MTPYTDNVVEVSIHAPYIGSDKSLTAISTALMSFNPRSLHRERQAEQENRYSHSSFNPRSLHRERPSITAPISENSPEFQSTLPT